MLGSISCLLKNKKYNHEWDLQVSVTEKRYINHFLFAHTTIRGKFKLTAMAGNIEVIEDIVPVYNVPVTVGVHGRVNRIYLAPQMEDLPFTFDGNTAAYVIPKVDCHQMIVMDIE